MSMKVLIADSDWRFAGSARKYLEAHAHMVVSHVSADQVLERVKHWQPDLVILAAELAEQGLLNEVHALRNRPAVLLTEHLDRYDRAWRAWQMGGDELLMKPVFRTSELHQAIVAALENSVTGRQMRPTAATA